MKKSRLSLCGDTRRKTRDGGGGMRGVRLLPEILLLPNQEAEQGF